MMRILYFLPFCLSLILLGSCQQTSVRHSVSGNKNSALLASFAESVEDSLEMIHAVALQNSFYHKLTADIETMPVASDTGEDAADDPAIWFNKDSPYQSLILGTNKTGGIYVYDLLGNILQYREAGRINNVDLRDGFIYNNQSSVLVAGSNRSNNCISLFCIKKPGGNLSDTLMNIKSGVDEVYGICLYRSPKTHAFYVFVNGKGGRVEQWKIEGGETLQASKVRDFDMGNQPEGMVASDQNARLYIGVEDLGIFETGAEPGTDTSVVTLPESDSLNTHITYDIEGLALFTYRNREYLIASSQGNFSYAIFRLGKNPKYITSFTIRDGHIDGVEETDGLEVSTAFLGSSFPMGMLVVQDGFNMEGDSLLNQNFKFVSLKKVLKLL